MKIPSKPIILTCCLAGLSASAQLTEFTTAASWQAAVSSASVSSINFDGIIGTVSDPNLGVGLPNYTYFSSPPGLTLGGANFQYTSATPGIIFLLGDSFYYDGQPAELSAQAVPPPSAPPGDPDGITVTFSSPVTAFNMTMESFFGSAFTFNVGGNSFTESAPALDSGLAFVGITSATPFSSFTVTTPAEFGMNFASLNYGTAITSNPGSVPDTFSTVWTLGMGLMGCGLFRRFRE